MPRTVARNAIRISISRSLETFYSTLFAKDMAWSKFSYLNHIEKKYLIEIWMDNKSHFSKCISLALCTAQSHLPNVGNCNSLSLLQVYKRSTKGTSQVTFHELCRKWNICPCSVVKGDFNEVNKMKLSQFWKGIIIELSTKCINNPLCNIRAMFLRISCKIYTPSLPGFRFIQRPARAPFKTSNRGECPLLLFVSE